jgi:hypothetical protein
MLTLQLLLGLYSLLLEFFTLNVVLHLELDNALMRFRSKTLWLPCYIQLPP